MINNEFLIKRVTNDKEQLMRDKMIIVGPMKELRIIVASLIEVQAKTKQKNKKINKNCHIVCSLFGKTVFK